MTKVINIAALRKPAAVVIEAEDGKKHEMVPASVASFLENLKEVEALGLDASPVQEAELILGVVKRSFPTLPAEQVEGWPIDILRNVYVSVIMANGEMVADNAEKAAEKTEEVKTSGKSAPAV